jgi:hypothetical protein
VEGFDRLRERYLGRVYVQQKMGRDPRWAKDYGNERHALHLYLQDVKDHLVKQTILWTPWHQAMLEESKKQHSQMSETNLVFHVRKRETESMLQRLSEHLMQFEVDGNHWRQAQKPAIPEKFWNKPEAPEQPKDDASLKRSARERVSIAELSELHTRAARLVVDRLR